MVKERPEEYDNEYQERLRTRRKEIHWQESIYKGTKGSMKGAKEIIDRYKLLGGRYASLCKMLGDMEEVERTWAEMYRI